MARACQPVRKWWINTMWKKVVGGPVNRRPELWMRMTPGFIASLTPAAWKIVNQGKSDPILLFGSLLLDYTSIDLKVWLGWFGFNVWYLIEGYDPERYEHLVSGIQLTWGRKKYLHEGEHWYEREETHVYHHKQQPALD
jgi:hypothetical protein